MRVAVLVLMLAGCFLLGGPARAYDPYDPANCNGAGWSDQHPMVVARVTARPRVQLVKSPYDDDFKAEGCPAATAACRRQAYLVTGDLVLVGERRGDFTCADHASPLGKGQRWTVGWLPTAALTPVEPMPAPEARDWIGTWLPHARIKISDAGAGRLRIEALKVIPTSGGDTQNGTFSAQVASGPTTLTFADSGSYGDGCQVRMQRIERWLLVEDNGGCGGAGVSFLGLYRRERSGR